MPSKVQRHERFRRALTLAAALACVPLGGVSVVVSVGAATPAAADVRGRLTLLEKNNRPGEDVGQAVIWLEGGAGRATPVEAEISTADKSFSPHVLVVPVGSTVAFPNHDPFNHNVFSLSDEQPFDLGLYGRGEARSIRVDRPGILRVYCNVHAQMSALIVVRDGPHFVQPSGDGSFTLPGVPPGRYVLHAWHERASEINHPLDVGPAGAGAVALELDARGYRFKPHLNKHGQPYPQQGRRY
jgi:plastocyanin